MAEVFEESATYLFIWSIKKKPHTKDNVWGLMRQCVYANSMFQSASTTFSRDESPHGIDRLGVVVALYLVR